MSDFLERCARDLPKAEYVVVAAAVLAGPVEGIPASAERWEILADYYAWERSMRAELAAARAKRLGKTYTAPTTGDKRRDRALARTAFEASACAAAANAVAAESPLEGELIIERARWDLLERLKTFRYFDTEWLAAYALEMRILERLACFDTDSGAARYKETYEAVLSAADTTMTGAFL